MAISALGPAHLYLDAERWMVRASAVRGASHERRGTGCQDAFSAAAKGRWYAAVAADGAGSAAKSAKGSSIASSSIVTSLLQPSGASVRKAIISAMGHARAAMAEEACNCGDQLGDYATTVVGVVMQGSNGIFFHLGDGLALAFAGAANAFRVRAMSTGTPSEFANVSSFLTQSDWQSHTIFTPVRAASSTMLLTDGFSPFALNTDGMAKSGFYKPILEFLSSHPGDVGAQALTDLMDRQIVRKTSGDDCTLVWAGHREQA